ncbi:hypothetical protein ACFLV6_00305 [Chloroflexota bacterium]
MTMPLTEKTLELNIMAELAYLARLAGYRPYFIGYSQWDELRHGKDTSFQAGSLIGYFQFKRGIRRSWFFSFYINNNKPRFDQHGTLLTTHLSTNACRYIFPLISTNADVFIHRGRLLYQTVSFEPNTFNPLNPSNKSHIVRLYDDGSWERYSDEYDIKTGKWTNIFGQSRQEEESFAAEVISIAKENEMARTLLKRLQLPNLENTLHSVDSINIKKVFKQKSSFCMVFAPE